MLKIFSLLLICLFLQCTDIDNITSIPTADKIDLIVNNTDVLKHCSCSKFSVEDVCLVKVSNSRFDTIFIHADSLDNQKWYEPEKACFFEEKQDTLFFIGNLLSCRFSGYMDTLLRNEEAYYCVHSSNFNYLHPEGGNHQYGYFAFPYHTSPALVETKHYELFLQMNKDKNKIKKMDYLIPIKTLKKGDQVRISDDKVLFFSWKEI